MRREIVFQEMPPVPGRAGHAFFYDPAWVAPCHFHPTPEFNLVLAGSAQYLVGGTLIAAGRGTLLWFAPGVAHGMLRASSDFHMRALRFELSFATRVMARFCGGHPDSLLSTADVARRLTEGDVVDLEAHGSAMDRVEWPCFAGSTELTGALLLRVRAAFLAGGRVAVAGRHPAVTRALDLLASDPELGRGALARSVGLSEAELSRRFRSGVGATVPQHKNRMRLGRVLELYCRGTKNLTQAALSAGFGSYSQFHRVFVEAAGCSPSDYFHGGLDGHWLSGCRPLTADALVRMGG